MNAELEKRVRAIYASADAAVAQAGPKCDASGRCCRFKEYGHTLFISQLEADVLLASAPAYQLPVTSDFCPFQIHNLCTAREPRPLGCRVYFCDPTYEETGNQITEDHLKQLKALSAEFDLGWRYAPLHIYLNEASPTRQVLSADQFEPAMNGGLGENVESGNKTRRSLPLVSPSKPD